MEASERPEPVDMRILADMLDGDREEMAEMLADFRASARTTAMELRASCKDGAPSQIAAYAHRLKSSSRWIGAMALADLCAAIERAARANQPDVVAGLMERMEVELAAVERFLSLR